MNFFKKKARQRHEKEFTEKEAQIAKLMRTRSTLLIKEGKLKPAIISQICKRLKCLITSSWQDARW